MQPSSLPSRNRNREPAEENASAPRKYSVWPAAFTLALWAILAACGRPNWAGGIHANLAWSPRGVRVIEVPPDGTAAEAGLLPDDRVLAIDGKPTAGLTQVQVHDLLTGEVGSYVDLVVLRGEETLKMRIKRMPYERAGE
ncbi:MAG: PDZ domain-containing protein [Myxococcales bacterium]